MPPIVFTDLDGTLLDRDTYSFAAAMPALERLKQVGVPLILTTSKTRAEVEEWRRLLGNGHPFIVENGGAAFIPRGYFPVAIPGAISRDGYEIVEWGKPYEDLIAAVNAARRTSGCRLIAFHQMTPEEVAAATNLPVAQAILAKRREYDEPFQIVDEDRSGRLLEAIEAQGLRWTRGGRFHHVHGSYDKASAMRLLGDLFQQVHGTVVTIGLGDALNDVPLLGAVDIPIIVNSPSAAALKRSVPEAFVTAHEGPEGWNEGVLKMVQASEV